MKKRKIKLFASLTSLVMVVAVMAVGIWAATSATVEISAKASFNAAKNVEALITVQETINGTEGEVIQEFISANLGTNTRAAELTGYTAYTDGITLNQGAIALHTDSTATYSYTVSVTNNIVDGATNESLFARISTIPTAAADNAEVSTQYAVTNNGEDNVTITDYTPATPITLQSGATVTWTISWTLTNAGFDAAEANLGVTVDLDTTIFA